MCDQQIKIMKNFKERIAAGGLEAANIHELKANLLLMEQAFTEFKQHHDASLLAVDIGDVDEYFKIRSDTQELYLEIRIWLVAKIAENEPLIQQPPEQEKVYRIDAKLEPHVGTFDGSPHDWITFRDLFTAEVIERADIPEVSKLRYLQEACIKQAAAALGPWTRAAQNFEPAWKTLKERYDDEFPMQQGLINKIFTLPELKYESYDELTNVVNVVQGVLRQLKAQKIEVEHWDPIIIYHLSQLLPTITMDVWEQKRKIGESPKLVDMLDFVQGRARGKLYIDHGKHEQKGNNKTSHTFTPIKERSSHQHGRQFPSWRADTYKRNSEPSGKPQQSYADGKGQQQPARQYGQPPLKGVAIELKCKMCGEGHHLYRCSKFLTASLGKRIELVDQWGLCRNCLRKHEKNACAFGNCVRCKTEQHNSVLCPQNKSQVNLVRANERKGRKRPAPEQEES